MSFRNIRWPLICLSALLPVSLPRTRGTPIPEARGPLPVTSTSYPFGAADHEGAPEDLSSVGYVEEEYVLSGKANVYDWPATGPAVVQTAGAPYTTRLIKMGLDEEGMGWHSFKRFRKTWLRGQRCLQDVNNFWMAHRPQTMSELYSHLHEELQLRLDEATRVGYGFVLPACENVPVVPIVPKSQQESATEIAA